MQRNELLERVASMQMQQQRQEERDAVAAERVQPWWHDDRLVVSGALVTQQSSNKDALRMSHAAP